MELGDYFIGIEAPASVRMRLLVQRRSRLPGALEYDCRTQGLVRHIGIGNTSLDFAGCTKSRSQSRAPMLWQEANGRHRMEHDVEMA